MFAWLGLHALALGLTAPAASDPPAPTPAASSPSATPSPAAPRPPPPPRLEEDQVEAIARESADRDRLTSPLRPRDDGGFDYSDPKGRFDAVIHADGRVTIELPPPFRGGICFGTFQCVAFDDLGDYLRHPERWQPELSSNQMWQALHGAPIAFGATSFVLGAMEMPIAPPLIGFGGRFGRRFTPRGPIMEFMRTTFEMRLRMAAGHQRDLIAYELHVLEDELAAIWEDPRLPLTTRRELLFELWDECLEGAAPSAPEGADDLAIELDRIRHEAADQARRRILAFARRHAAWGTPAAFTPAELRRFNLRRQSRARFDPYR